MEQMNAVNDTLYRTAAQIETLYENFTQDIQSLGSKAKDGKRSSKMGESFARWIGGGSVVSVREQLCETFLNQVQGQLELLQTLLEGATPQEAEAVCALAAAPIFRPCPPRSNATTDLMKRAMIGQGLPLLPYLSPATLTQLHTQLQGAYNRWQRLPVEKEVLEALEQEIQKRG